MITVLKDLAAFISLGAFCIIALIWVDVLRALL